MRGVYSANKYVGSVGNAQTLMLLVVPTNKVIEIITATMSNTSNTSGEQLISGLNLVDNINPALTISHVALTSNVATITTSAAHSFVTGEIVEVLNLTNAFFDGVYTIASVPTSTTFTYSLTHTNVSGTTDSGTAAAMPVVITNVALTSNVVTITTATPYGWGIGKSVYISGLANSFLNGIYSVVSVPTSTTFTYGLTHADLSSTVDLGTASFFPTAASVTPVVLEGGSASSVVQAYGPITAGEPVYDLNALHQEGWSSQIGYRYQPFPEGRPFISSSGIIGLRLLQNPATSFNGVGEIIYREIG